MRLACNVGGLGAWRGSLRLSMDVVEFSGAEAGARVPTGRPRAPLLDPGTNNSHGIPTTITRL